jgi:predicted nucleotide-binding protein
MKERFAGPDGKRLLVDALAKQVVIGERQLAAAIAERSTVEEYANGALLIAQGGHDNAMFFILSGNVSIQINGREVVRRGAGQHVGEMALLDPSAPRSASVIAIELVVVARVLEPDLEEIGRDAAQLWRNLARELSVRMHDRDAFIPPRNARPRLFIGSSTEGLPIAREIQSALRNDPVDVIVWTDTVFGASRYLIEDLESQVKGADFAALVFGPDDSVTSRAATLDAPRDNVIFELGLFLGVLGRRRTFFVRPVGANLKIPSDLLGLTPLEYGQGTDLPVVLAPLCNDIRKAIAQAGPR